MEHAHRRQKEEEGEGSREGRLQISAISQPDCLLTDHGHYTAFPLDGGSTGLSAGGRGKWGLQKEAPNVNLMCHVFIKNVN